MQPTDRDQQDSGAGSNRVAFISGTITGAVLAFGGMAAFKLLTWTGDGGHAFDTPPEFELAFSLIEVAFVILLVVVVFLAMVYLPRA